MNISEFLDGISEVAIAGHVHPDGDCVGSCLGLYIYLKENYPQLHVRIYLEELKPEFVFLQYANEVRTVYDGSEKPDLLILNDVSSADRVGVAAAAMDDAKNILCFDHHKTNTETFTWKFNMPDMSSASEVVWNFLDPLKVSRACAEALYLGIVHDTGVFQYSCTSPETMRTAALLMEKGIEASRIIDETYYQKTWAQKHMLGVVLSGCRLHRNGTCISAIVSKQLMRENQVEAGDLDGIVAQMRSTAGVDTAVFLYEAEDGVWKVSLRSRQNIDVSVIAQYFGGGGHARAAGCTVEGDPESILQQILAKTAEQTESVHACD
ncbi:MAG: DHH family phosphoesterase [Lachnospiraceae bacterium]|nr:DHH family phosphoesterase [Lachnospiraceae bacterium]